MSEEQQRGAWADMSNKMFNNFTAFSGQGKAMEPFIQLTKIRQQHCLDLSRAWIDCMWKLGEASRSGDVKKVWETCLETNNNLSKACQEAMKEQAVARYELWRNLKPSFFKSAEA
ncbi:MAG: hypothetical protein NTV58_08900 [Deltaproteobacteria bacterium]|nr:hypothetical protein [Deltaproteobacteria bacterium]